MKLSQVSVLVAGLFSSVVLAQVEQVIQVGHLLDVRTGNYQKNKAILVEAGRISAIVDADQAPKNVQVIDLSTHYVVPGLIDMHVHLREPGREDTETVKTGSNAAAVGGFTGVACMPNTNPAIDSAEVVNFIKEKATNHLVDVYPIGAVSKGRQGENLAPIAELVDAGAVGFSDDGVAVKTASLVRNALEYLKRR